MRVAENLPSHLKVIAALLTLLGLALNLMLAISPLWGWHPFLGWCASIVLLAFVWEERRSIRAALSGLGRTADRVSAYCLLTAAIVAILVNTVIALAAA
ncbi:hypothetical protein KAK07_01465 [Ideonella sp. 4Y16]|uniref:hypothetical protein n=1 Tax=Ideonella alba TaxID=2824118 RepID=UPI001B367595|nr:hypothetical protein [Ideonella alba]MBQ0941994.1 hypothetical protein [Ideonella alba]